MGRGRRRGRVARPPPRAGVPGFASPLPPPSLRRGKSGKRDAKKVRRGRPAGRGRFACAARRGGRDRGRRRSSAQRGGYGVRRASARVDWRCEDEESGSSSLYRDAATRGSVCPSRGSAAPSWERRCAVGRWRCARSHGACGRVQATTSETGRGEARATSGFARRERRAPGWERRRARWRRRFAAWRRRSPIEESGSTDWYRRAPRLHGRRRSVASCASSSHRRCASSYRGCACSYRCASDSKRRSPRYRSRSPNSTGCSPSLHSRCARTP